MPLTHYLNQPRLFKSSEWRTYVRRDVAHASFVPAIVFQKVFDDGSLEAAEANGRHTLVSERRAGMG